MPYGIFVNGAAHLADALVERFKNTVHTLAARHLEFSLTPAQHLCSDILQFGLHFGYSFVEAMLQRIQCTRMHFVGLTQHSLGIIAGHLQLKFKHFNPTDITD